MAKFSDEQLITIRIQFPRIAEHAAVAFWSFDADQRRYHCGRAFEALSKAMTELGFLIEPISKDAASKPEARSEAEEGGASLPPSTHPGLGASS